MVRSNAKLFALSCALLSLTSSAVTRYPDVWQAQRYSLHKVDPARFAPSIGSSINLPEKDVFGNPVPLRSSKAVLALVGECMSCSVKSLDYGLLRDQYRVPIILVFESPEDDVKEIAVNLSGDFIVIADEEQTIASALNADWRPRLYLLRDSIVSDYQKAPGEVPKW